MMQHTVLVADDDESIRFLLMTLLDEAGYRTIVAENGKMAVDLTLQHKPDIVLLDVMMPGMDGFAACRAIKNDQRTADIPVLLLTALAQTTSKVEGLDCGASDYITKPFVTTELLARLRANLIQKNRRDELAVEALTDALTRLSNRRAVEQQLDHFLAHSRRSSESLSLMIFDIDHFKIVNDTYGHQIGDAVLIALAQQARDVMRAQDTLGRWGGEEFMAIMPGTGRDSALIAAERLRAHIEETRIPTSAGPVSVTVSVGVATTSPLVELASTSLVAAADLALYGAKRAGRNRVVHADGQPTAPLTRSEPPEAAHALINALEVVHAPTARHSRLIAEVCWELCAALCLAPSDRSRIGLAGLLHDIGKLALHHDTAAQAEAKQRHNGKRDLAYVYESARLLQTLPTLSVVIPLVASHLERWDGSGVPRGLRGEDIPLGSRVIAVAHAFDSLPNAQEAPRDSHQHTLSILKRGAGRQFDPDLAELAARMIR